MTLVLDKLSNELTHDIDQIVKDIIGTLSVPFTAKHNEFKELLNIIEVLLEGIHDEKVEQAVISEYLLLNYVKEKSARKIRKELKNPNPRIQLHPRIQELLNIPQPEQKSQAWLNQRQSYITASVFGDACGLKGPVALVTLLLNKVTQDNYRPFHGNKATHWGEKYEPVANDIYAYRMECRIYEFGLIPHSEIPFLGASTDGVTDSLTNIEIKCPFSRLITGITPIGYWAQTQLQMEVLDLSKTHFLECSFYEYESEQAFFTDFEWIEEVNIPLKGDQVQFKHPPPKGHHREKGIILEAIDLSLKNLEGNPKTVYIYSPTQFYKSKEGLQNWKNNKIQEMLESQNMIYIRTIPWVLTRLSCVEILRDKEWFQMQIPKLKEFWKDVEHYKSLNLSMAEIERLKDKLVKKYSGSRSFKNSSKSSSSSGSSSSSSSRSSPSRAPKPFKECLLDSDTEIEVKKGKKGANKCLLGSDDEEFIIQST